MKSVRFAVLSMVLVLLVPAMACNDDHSPTSPMNTHDTLTLESINPMGGIVPAGNVRCQATLRWEMLSSATGDLIVASWWENRILETLRTENRQHLEMRRGQTTLSFPLSFPAESAGRTRLLQFLLVPEASGGEASASFNVLYTVASP
jgi:hypothetical protein